MNFPQNIRQAIDDPNTVVWSDPWLNSQPLVMPSQPAIDSDDAVRLRSLGVIW